MADAAEDHSDGAALREKRHVALTSVIAAVFLTGMKLVVGLLTGSLGILSEAAHSALDLVAAAVTFFAVRVSGRPADVVHTYGHGKIENLSALFETLLLLVTCIWIIYEAIQRLFFRPVEIEANVWSFLVMGTSIVIDFSRSRALYRVARKYNSQALEADALHFSTDIWSSSVVIGGLALVRLSEALRMDWLMKADAIAAMGVAGIVTYVSLQLGKRTIAALLDSAPAGSQPKLLAAAQVPGVQSVTRARLRRSGPETFADLTLAVASDTTVEQAHEIAGLAETSIRQVMPGTDLVIHIEPDGRVSNGIVSTVQRLAMRHGLKAHGIRVYHAGGYRSLELHLEVQDTLRLDEAHALATAFENELAKTLPDIKSIVTHMEPVGEGSASRQAAPGDEESVRRVLKTISAESGLECQFYDLKVRRLEDGLSVSFRCSVEASTAVAEAHRLTEKVEQALRDRLPGLGRVVIHVEPSAQPSAR